MVLWSRGDRTAGLSLRCFCFVAALPPGVMGSNCSCTASDDETMRPIFNSKCFLARRVPLVVLLLSLLGQLWSLLLPLPSIQMVSHPGLGWITYEPDDDCADNDVNVVAVITVLEDSAASSWSGWKDGAANAVAGDFFGRTGDAAKAVATDEAGGRDVTEGAGATAGEKFRFQLTTACSSTTASMITAASL